MIQPRRAVHAASLAISAAAGSAVASMVASAMGAGAGAAGAICFVTAAATFLGAWPALVAGPMPVSRYGMLVMAGSGMRLLATLALALAADMGTAAVGAGDRTGFWLGVVIAAGVVLVADSAVAVTALNRAGREDAGSESRSSRESA